MTKRVNIFKYDNGLLSLVFLFWPFLAVVVSFFTRRRGFSFLLYPFFFLFGYSLYVPGRSSDLYVYSKYFHKIANYDFSDYTNYIKNLYTTADQPDLYAISLNFFVSRITDDWRIVFGIVAMVQFHFMLKLFLLVKEKFYKKNKASFLAFGIMVLMIPLQTITGIRFWTAFFIFIYYGIKLLFDPKLKYLIYLSVTPFIHFTYILPLLLIVPFIFLKRHFWMNVIFALLSIFLSNTFIDTLRSAETTSESIKSRQEDYLSESNLSKREEVISSLNVYTKWDSTWHYYFLIGFAIFILIRNRKEDVFLEKMLPLFLFTLALAVMVKDFGSVARYARFFDMIGFIFLTRWLSLNRSRKEISIFTGLLLPIFLVKVYVSGLRGTLMLVDPQLIIGNVYNIITIRSEEGLSQFLFDWIK